MPRIRRIRCPYCKTMTGVFPNMRVRRHKQVHPYHWEFRSKNWRCVKDPKTGQLVDCVGSSKIWTWSKRL